MIELHQNIDICAEMQPEADSKFVIKPVDAVMQFAGLSLSDCDRNEDQISHSVKTGLIEAARHAFVDCTDPALIQINRTVLWIEEHRGGK